MVCVPLLSSPSPVQLCISNYIDIMRLSNDYDLVRRFTVKLAIIISVATYGGSIPDLPGCENDDAAMMTLISESREFDDILHLNAEPNAAAVKQHLVDFVSKHKGADVDEVFFYFTGHGDFTGDEFYYLLSDYDDSRHNQTTLQNSELDTFLRTLSPNLTAKFVDACFSGVQYIKDRTLLSEYLAKGQQDESLGKCYFLFSSHSNQRSYQDAELSHFTRAVVESVIAHPGESIRYKDIADYVADFFAESVEQKPFFVVQADFTERFCSISKGLRDALAITRVPGIGTKRLEEATGASHKLVDSVRRDAERYCTILEVEEKLGELPAGFGRLLPGGEMADLYDVEVSTLVGMTSRVIQAVGRWLEQNHNEYLVSVQMEMMPDYASGPIPGFREAPATIRTNLDVPYRTIVINAMPRFANIPPMRGFVFPVASKAELRLFYGFSDLRETGVDKYSLNTEVVWQTAVCSIGLEVQVERLMQTVWDSFVEFSLGILRKQLGLEEDSDAVQEETTEGDETG